MQLGIVLTLIECMDDVIEPLSRHMYSSMHALTLAANIIRPAHPFKVNYIVHPNTAVT